MLYLTEGRTGYLVRCLVFYSSITVFVCFFHIHGVTKFYQYQKMKYVFLDDVANLCIFITYSNYHYHPQSLA